MFTIKKGDLVCHKTTPRQPMVVTRVEKHETFFWQKPSDTWLCYVQWVDYKGRTHQECFSHHALELYTQPEPPKVGGQYTMKFMEIRDKDTE